VLVGPVVVGASGFSDIIPIFKQLTEGGFATASNQIVGNVIVTIGADTISVEMQGQVQPFELESKFSGIGASSFQIANDVDGAVGVIANVNLDLFDTHTTHSVDFATFYLGFQPGTDVTQTETLSFTSVVGLAPFPSLRPGCCFSQLREPRIRRSVALAAKDCDVCVRAVARQLRARRPS